MKKTWMILLLLVMVVTLFSGCNSITNITDMTGESDNAVENILEDSIPFEEIEPSEGEAAPTPTNPKNNPDLFPALGTAEYIDGKTAIVSVFVNDANTQWDWNVELDANKRKNMLANLKKATQWISNACQKYGAEPEFICDWQENSDLYLELTIDENLVLQTGEAYYTQRYYVLENFHYEEMLQKLDVQNMLFILFFNTPDSNQTRSIAFTTFSSNLYDVEMVNAYVNTSGWDISDQTLAHEILHCFGAQDLYYANERIPQEYVNYLQENTSMDIMFQTDLFTEHNLFLSDVDAYYLGLITTCEEVTEWGIGPSQHSLFSVEE